MQFFRQRTETLLKFAHHFLNVTLITHIRQAPVQTQTQRRIRNIFFGNLRHHRQINRRRVQHALCGIQRLVRVLRVLAVPAFRVCFCARFLNCAREQTRVQIQTDCRDMPRLPRAENFARTANFQIAHRHLKARAQFRCFRNRLQTHARFVRNVRLLVVQKIRKRARGTAPDAPAQLIQLRQTKTVCVIDNDGVGVRNINAAFDDGGANQHIVLARRKFTHHRFELVFMHLPVTDAHARFRHKFAQLVGENADALHAIVHKKYLPAAVQFAQNRIAHQTVLVRRYVRANRQPFIGRRFDGGHVARAAQRQIQRARNRRRRQRQHIHIRAQLFQTFFVLHTKTLFFIHNQQAQIFERDILRQNAMRTDDNINRAVRQFFYNLILLFVGTKTRQHFHAHRKRRETLLKCIEMLLRQNCRRHKNRYLLAIHHCFECRAQCDFGFAVTHIADNQAVHRTLLLHVAFDLVNHCELV